MLNKLWLYNKQSYSQAKSLSKELDISVLLSKVLISRGFNDINYIKGYLNPRLEDLHNPFLLKDMDKAVSRIIRAVEDRENILVYGDYDVDGTTSTAILIKFLSSRGASVEFYIPDRQEEGYGLSINAIDNITNTGVSLIITVDCGITAIEEVKYAAQKGIDVIITDHHQCQEKLPGAYAVINPCRPDCEYPFKQLAGVGVVYKLLTALCINMNLGDEYNKYLDIVAVGTVADVVPLVDENRIIVKYGIDKLENTKNPGLMSLMHIAGLRDRQISTFSISFGLAPRVNAAGRIGSAERAVNLFVTEDACEAESIASELNEENKFRQDTELCILQQAVQIIEAEMDFEKEKVIVVAGEGWHHGVIGIVASKISEKYYRPCILLSVEDGICKGSGRSIEGFNLFSALNHCKDFLDKYGGHELAAGLSIKLENLDGFRRAINAYADDVISKSDLIPKLKIDVCIDKNDITLDSIKQLDKLAPFGAGNPGPLFSYKGFRVKDKKTVGDNKHLKLKLLDEDFLTDAIGFNMGQKFDELNCDNVFDVACTLEVNVWNSIEKIQLNLKDIRPNIDVSNMNDYYVTLHKCLRIDAMKHHTDISDISKKFKTIIDTEEFDNLIANALKDSNKIAVFVNSLESLRDIENILSKQIKDPVKNYGIYFSNCDIEPEKIINIIVNPDFQILRMEMFEKIIVYGDWVDLLYLSELSNYVDIHKIFLYNIGVYNFEKNDITCDRTDLKAIYQFLKTNCKSTSIIDNMHSTASKIGENYKIIINCFKLRQGIEIFEELKLLTRKYLGSCRVSITMEENIRSKTDLENSLRYRKLKALKDQLNGG